MTAPAIIAGAASLIGGGIATGANFAQAAADRKFQKMMSDTAYQRAVADMRLAGINPMLAFSQGGASTPGGRVIGVDDAVGPAVSSALHARRLSDELLMMRKQRRLMETQEQKNLADVGLAAAHAVEADERAELSRLEQKRLRAELPGLQNRARVEGTFVGTAAAYVQRIREAIFGGSGMLLAPRVGGGPSRKVIEALEKSKRLPGRLPRRRSY